MAPSSQKVCYPVYVHNVFLKVGLCICLKLPSYLLYGAFLSFSSAGFEQQFCFHLHAFANLKYTLPQVSSLQMNKSQPFALSLQGSCLIPGLFLLPFSLCSFANSFAILLEMGSPNTSQPSSCECTRVLCGGKMTPSLVHKPLLTHPILPWGFFDHHYTLQQWFQKIAWLSLRDLSRAATTSSKFSVQQGRCG